MNKTIHELNSLTQAQADDEFIIYDVSEGESKKIQVQAMKVYRDILEQRIHYETGE